MNTTSQYRNTVTSASTRTIAEAIAPVMPNASFVALIEQAAQKFITSLNPTALKAFNGRLAGCRRASGREGFMKLEWPAKRKHAIRAV